MIESHARVFTIESRVRLIASVIAILLLAILPFIIGTSYYIGLGASVLISTIFLSGLGLAAGKAGLISVAHGGIYGVGGYTSGLLMTKRDWDFWSTIPMAIIISGLLGLLLGILTLRLSGHYFVIATLVVAVIIPVVLTNLRTITNGPLGVLGIERPERFSLTVDFYYLVLGVVILVTIGLIVLDRSRFGVGLRAIGQNDVLAASLGYSVVRYRLLALIISAGLAGLAGSFNAIYIGYLDPSSADYMVGFEALLAVIIGGASRRSGPFLGSLVFVLVPSFLSDTMAALQPIVMGLALMLIVRFMPGGLAGFLNRCLSVTLTRVRRRNVYTGPRQNTAEMESING